MGFSSWRIPTSGLPQLGGETVSFLAPVQDVFSALAVSLQLPISAGIAPDGRVLPVDHISEKIHAVERVPGLTDVIMAEDQSKVQTGPYHQLRIWKVRHAADLDRHSRHA